MERRGPAIFSVVIALIMSGCGISRVHNLTPADHLIPPKTQIYKDPEFSQFAFRTFSVFPASLINEKAEIKGDILEKQMMFSLRNSLEVRGFKFVELNESPDLLVTIDGSVQYKEIYVPPQIGRAHV